MTIVTCKFGRHMVGALGLCPGGFGNPSVFDRHHTYEDNKVLVLYMGGGAVYGPVALSVLWCAYQSLLPKAARYPDA